MGRADRLGPAGLAVTLAGAAVNAIAYVLPLLGARRLSPADLGVLATLLALIAIATVPGFGLQVAVAVRRAQTGPGLDARAATWVTAGATAGAVLVTSPVLLVVLRLPGWVPPLLAVMAGAVVLGSRPLGELQGGQQFVRLAAGMVALALARYAGLLAGLVAGLDLLGSMLLAAAVAVAVVPALAWLGRGTGAAVGGRAPAGPPVAGRAVLAATSANLAMLLVANLDVILARYRLPAAAVGGYAVGAVLTKGAIWAPQVVTVLALPRLAQGEVRARRVAVALVAACGLVLTLATLAASGLAVRLAGGSGYAWLARYAPLFALTGAAYALAFLFLNARIAAGVRRPAAPAWSAAAGLTVAVLALPRPAVGSVVAVAAVVAVALAAGAAAGTDRALTPVRPAGTGPS